QIGKGTTSVVPYEVTMNLGFSPRGTELRSSSEAGGSDEVSSTVEVRPLRAASEVSKDVGLWPLKQSAPQGPASSLKTHASPGPIPPATPMDAESGHAG